MTASLRRCFALAAALGLAVSAACGGGGGDDGDAGRTSTTAADAMTVHPASYDLVASEPQRFIAGVSLADGRLLSFGEVELFFNYLGTRDDPVNPPRPGPRATATFLPVPGDEPREASAEPRPVEPSVARGVYGANDVVFDAAGFWQVGLQVDVDGRLLRATAAFGVNDAHLAPAVGEQAPDTSEPVAGAAGVAPVAIDSRAQDGTIPDPTLHQTTVADALALGQPVMVVVATPVYCRSRFCGPITDAVEEIAAEFGDRMAFVHIEVWEDFEAQKVNPAARAWMSKGNAEDLQEPWVFVVGRDGIIKARWDNVATEAELRDGVMDALA